MTSSFSNTVTNRCKPQQNLAMFIFLSQKCEQMVLHRHLLFVECLKLLTPDLKETWTLMRTHKSPVLILLHTTHEQVWNPESKEQVSSSVFLSTSVLPAIQKLENVSMPRLQVNRKRSGTLTTNNRTIERSTKMY